MGIISQTANTRSEDKLGCVQRVVAHCPVDPRNGLVDFNMLDAELPADQLHQLVDALDGAFAIGQGTGRG